METSLLALLGFSVVSYITPGPNNVMVSASAAMHGVRGTVPHMIGIAVGFAIMIGLVGLGLAGVITAAPMVALGLRWVMFAWLLLLAWRIAQAGRPGQGAARPPLGFWGAAAFQWVNPKAWLLALTVNSVFITPDRPMLPQLALNFAVFLAVGMPCLLVWALLGSGAGRLLGSPLRLRIFNVTMAALLVISMLPMALGWE
jgi:threonine/homoserine/homoserine lactone efflux protein